MKKLGWIAGGLVALLLAAAFLVPTIMDWDRFKAPLIARIEAETGRTVTLSGPIKARLLPSPMVSVQGVAIANPQGLTGDLAQVDGVRLHVAFLPLLTGRVRVVSLELSRPRITLIQPAQGAPNWSLAKATSPHGSSADGVRATDVTPSSVPGVTGSLPVDEVVINNGELSYADSAGQKVAVTEMVGRLRADSLGGPFSVDGAAKVNGTLLSFKTRLETLTPGRAAPLSISLGLPGDESKLLFQGQVLSEADGRAVRGHVALSSADPRRLLARIGLNPPLPVGDLAVESDVALSRSEVSLANLVASLGDFRATGAINAALDDVPQVDAQISIAALNLDKWQAAPAAEGEGASAPNSAPSGGGAGPSGTANANRAQTATAVGFVLPTRLFAALSVSIEALSWHGEVARGAKLDVALDQGEAMVRSLSLQLPGNSALNASGTLTTPSGKPVFDGQMRLQSDSLRNLLTWAGANPTQVPETRLRTLAMETSVHVEDGEVRLPDFRATLDTSHLRGGLVARLGGRPAFGLSANLDSLNLTAYLPANPGAGTGATGQGGATVSQAAHPRPATPSTTPDDLGFDANVMVVVKSLSVGTTIVENAMLDALLQGGQADIRRLSGAVGGNQVTAHGKLAEVVSGHPRLDKVAFQVDAAQPARLLAVAGGNGASKLPPFTLSGVLNGSLGESALDFADLSLSMRGNTVGGHGRVDWSGAKPMVDGELSAGHLNLDTLFSGQRSGSLLPGGFRLPPAIQPLSAPVVPAAAGAVGFGDSPFTREPLVLDGLAVFDGNVGVNVQTVTIKGWTIEHVTGRIQVKDGGAVLDGLNGRVLGGDLAIRARMVPQPEPTLTVEMDISGADLAKGPMALGGGLTVTRGVLTSRVRFAASGRSSQEMATRLNGDASLTVRDGVVDGFDLPAVDRRLASIDNIGGLLAVVQTGLDGGQTPFSQLGGTFVAQNGLLTSKDVRLDAQGGGASAESRVDLPRWSTETAVDLHLASAAQVPLRLRIEGPLDNPRKIVDINALQRYLITRGLNKALKGGDTQQGGDQPQEKNTGKNILKNLLRGLGGQ